jgi:hypothetical protein
MSFFCVEIWPLVNILQRKVIPFSVKCMALESLEFVALGHFSALGFLLRNFYPLVIFLRRNLTFGSLFYVEIWPPVIFLRKYLTFGQYSTGVTFLRDAVKLLVFGFLQGKNDPLVVEYWPWGYTSTQKNDPQVNSLQESLLPVTPAFVANFYIFDLSETSAQDITKTCRKLHVIIDVM